MRRALLCPGFLIAIVDCSLLGTHSCLLNAKQIKSNARRLDSVILLIKDVKSQRGMANIGLLYLMKQ